MKRSLKKGFTLIELMIVIAIIGVLAALLVPTLSSLSEDSRVSACNDYRTAAIAQYASKTVGDPSYTLTRFLIDEAVSCPYGGSYSASKDADGNNVIICSLHGLEGGGGAEDPGTAVGRSVYETYLSFVQKYDAATPEEQKEMAKGHDNDKLRDALLAQSGGSWPQFPQSLIDKYGIKVPEGQTLYVQPFVNTNREADGYTQVVVYASIYPQNGKWYVGLVYDHEEGVWYQGPGISVTSPWETIKATIHDASKRWKPLTE